MDGDDEQDDATGHGEGSRREMQQIRQDLAEDEQDDTHDSRGRQHLPADAPLRLYVHAGRYLDERHQCDLRTDADQQEQERFDDEVSVDRARQNCSPPSPSEPRRSRRRFRRRSELRRRHNCRGSGHRGPVARNPSARHFAASVIARCSPLDVATVRGERPDDRHRHRDDDNAPHGVVRQPREGGDGTDQGQDDADGASPDRPAEQADPGERRPGCRGAGESIPRSWYRTGRRIPCRRRRSCRR